MKKTKILSPREFEVWKGLNLKITSQSRALDPLGEKKRSRMRRSTQRSNDEEYKDISEDEKTQENAGKPPLQQDDTESSPGTGEERKKPVRIARDRTAGDRSFLNRGVRLTVSPVNNPFKRR